MSLFPLIPACSQNITLPEKLKKSVELKANGTIHQYMHIIKEGETAFLIAASKGTAQKTLKENLDELANLSQAVGLHPTNRFTQNLKTFDPAFLIGSGKRKEIQLSIETSRPNYLIFDHDLSGVQIRNLKKEMQASVIDRSQLILEIFAQRAKSFEGKLQVELARHLDQLSRTVGAWLGSLSRQGGGSNIPRGPGEKVLEIDRRSIRSTIKKIRKKLDKVHRSRAQRRKNRKKRQIPSFALVGYTNSGKSTLLNTLTNANAETKNQAFMTLDPRTRKVFIPGGPSAVITDTVGFIRNLPHHLIDAFQATLEESKQADILLHVIDASSPQRDNQIQVVNELIKEFHWEDKPLIHIFNKMDLLADSKQKILDSDFNFSVFISAKTGTGLPHLLNTMQESLKSLSS